MITQSSTIEIVPFEKQPVLSKVCREALQVQLRSETKGKSICLFKQMAGEVILPSGQQMQIGR